MKKLTNVRTYKSKPPSLADFQRAKLIIRRKRVPRPMTSEGSISDLPAEARFVLWAIYGITRPY